MTNEPTEWEEIFAKYITDSELTAITYKELNSVEKSPILKWATEQTFFKRKHTNIPKIHQEMLIITNQETQ